MRGTAGRLLGLPWGRLVSQSPGRKSPSQCKALPGEASSPQQVGARAWNGACGPCPSSPGSLSSPAHEQPSLLTAAPRLSILPRPHHVRFLRRGLPSSGGDHRQLLGGEALILPKSWGPDSVAWLQRPSSNHFIPQALPPSPSGPPRASAKPPMSSRLRPPPEPRAPCPQLPLGHPLVFLVWNRPPWPSALGAGSGSWHFTWVGAALYSSHSLSQRLPVPPLWGEQRRSTGPREME